MKKYKVDKYILLIAILFFIISVVSIYSTRTILSTKYENLYIKQIIWYIIGFIIAFKLINFKSNIIFKHIWILYFIGNLSLIGLLFFGTSINNAKCWYSIKGIGTIEPSEFMKIILILVLANMLKNYNNKNKKSIKEEFIFLLKVFIVVLIPSIITFLEPDTGSILIYLLITLVMLYIGGIRYRWFILLFFIIVITLGVILFIYFTNNDLFLKIFGTSFYLRIDRLLDWHEKSGYQLSNSLVAIGSAGMLGHGIFNTPIYFPEAETDFIFAVFASNFGLLGSLILLILIAVFDIRIITIAIKSKKNIDKYIISGILGMLIYQQFQNIGMTFGLMPITGITLPFISYGGSSLISYMIMLGIIFNISNKNILKK